MYPPEPTFWLKPVRRTYPAHLRCLKRGLDFPRTPIPQPDGLLGPPASGVLVDSTCLLSHRCPFRVVKDRLRSSRLMPAVRRSLLAGCSLRIARSLLFAAGRQLWVATHADHLYSPPLFAGLLHPSVLIWMSGLGRGSFSPPQQGFPHCGDWGRPAYLKARTPKSGLVCPARHTETVAIFRACSFRLFWCCSS